MVPGSLAIIAAAYPRDQRGWAIGIWAAASSLTTILGPIIGGFLLTGLGDWSWRLVFAVNLPLGAISLALLYWKVPNDRPGAGPRLDLPGAALVTAGLLRSPGGLPAMAAMPRAAGQPHRPFRGSGSCCLSVSSSGKRGQKRR